MSLIKKNILEQVARRTLSQEEARRLLTELAAGAGAQSRDEPIAIIGMAGRFPGSRDAAEFWQVLRNGLSCIGDFPAARKKDFEHVLRNPSWTEFLIDATIPPEHVDHAHAPAGYVAEIDKFDAAFFGIPPAEAAAMDPHQRAALEVSWEAMEDAGYGGRSLYGSRTGVFIGKEGTNYSLYRYCTASHPMQLTGSWESIMASRISWLFDFSGPCMLVDTACSAGLVSVHMAAQSILNGDCDQALAGGINLSVTGEFGRGYQGSMAMDAVESRDSVIRTFDGRANGTVWGEGVAMVLLKRLSKAIADRDPIHAVIRGSAINNDGASSGLTAPDAESQEQVILEAWRKAGVDPSTLGYIEAHGTGTVLGDPIEFKALSAAFRRHTQRRQFCAIGSLKTNMGHLVAASGVASLFKVVKSIEHGQLAPTINFGQPNPFINFLGSPLYVNDTLRRWPAEDGPRRAALSSFGFSHTNCHMVVEEAPELPTTPPARPAYLFTLSAQTAEVLRTYAQRMHAHLAARPFEFADACFTSNVGRGHEAHRLALVVSDGGELLAGLRAAADAIDAGAGQGRIHYGRHAVVSDRKKVLAAGELTDKSRQALSRQAAEVVAALPGGDVRGALQHLAELYVQGAEVEWIRVHQGDARRRLSLPVYPLQRIRVWAEPKISKVVAQQHLHPLVQRLVSQDDAQASYESVFRTDREWVLSDHRIQGAFVVPGTSYLEMARFAAGHALGWHRLAMQDVFFLAPMVVAEGESRIVRLTLTRGDGHHVFAIESSDGAGGWQRHVEGRIAAASQPASAAVDLAGLQAAADEHIAQFVAETDTGVFQFGPHWDTIRSAWRLGADALAQLALPAPLQGELQTFQLHPSVLDNAVNLVSQTHGSTYLPFTYKSLRIHGPMTAPLFSHVVSKSQPGGETLTYDVTLSDAQGQVLVEINDYVVKKVGSFAGLGAADHGADGEYLAPCWLPAEATDAEPQACRHLLLIGADNADAPRRPLVSGEARTAANLAEALIRQGVQASVMTLGDPATASGTVVAPQAQALADFARSDALQGVDGIVWMVGNTEADASQRRNESIDALWRLVQGLLAAKASLPWGLAVLSWQAFEVNGQEPAIDAYGAAAQALGSVIGMEYAQLPCRLVDTAAEVTPERLARELLRVQPGRVVALREEGMFARALAPLALDAAPTVAPQADGFYLVTGGTGGLGLALAQHLVSQAPVKLVLVGRGVAPQADWPALASGDDARQAARYRALLALREQAGAIDCVACDLRDAGAVEAMLAQARAKHGALRGVYHLAGVAGNGFLLRKDFERFDAVVHPKLEGLVNLYRATAADQPERFVLFSSIVALTGGEGQGDYAAANAFMDAFAAQARREGRRLTSINWPSWKEVGMAADHQVDAAQSPFVPLATVDALARLDRITAVAPVQVLASTIQPAALAAVQEQLPFVLAPELQRRLAPAASAGAGAGDEEAAVHIRGKNEEDLSATEGKLARIYAAVLGLAEIDVFTSFYDMGGNSLIATHLLKLIDRHFPGMVDISDVFSYATVDDMAAYISGKQVPTPAVAPAAADSGFVEMLDRVVSGDADVGALLEQIK